MPGSHHEWAFQMPLSKAPAAGKWRVFIVARVEGEPAPGTNFSAGIWDSGQNKSLGQIAPGGKAVSNEYQLYELGVIQPSKTIYVWVAPVSDGSVKAVWVDRVLLVEAP